MQRSSTKKKQVDRVLTRAPIDPKKKNTKNHFYKCLSCQCLYAGAGRAMEAPAESYSTSQLVLAPHQKDEEQPRRVNNKHHEAYWVLPREMVRRP